MVPPELLKSFAAMPGRTPQSIEWDRNGDAWLAVLAWDTLGQHSIAASAAVPVVLVVALNRSSTTLMLDQFYRQLVFCARGRRTDHIGDRFAVAWHGLRQLRQIDATASAITADRLTEASTCRAHRTKCCVWAHRSMRCSRDSTIRSGGSPEFSSDLCARAARR
jgi:hypothetical protein